MIALLDVGRGVRDQRHGAPAVGQPAQRVHQLLLQSRIKPRGGFVQKEHARLGQQLHADRDALALPAAQAAHDLLGLRVHVHFGQHALDARIDFIFRRVAGQAQQRRIAQRLAHRQFAVDDVVLRHVTDEAAIQIEVGVIVVAVEQDAALGGIETAERVEQRGLARSRSADDGDELARRDRQRDVVQDQRVRHPRGA